MNISRWMLLTQFNLLATAIVGLAPSIQQISWMSAEFALLLPLGLVAFLIRTEPSFLLVLLNSVCWAGVVEFILSRLLDGPKDSNDE